MPGRRQTRRADRGIKGAVARGLAGIEGDIDPTAAAIRRLAVKIEAIVDAYIEAGEFTISPRRKKGSGKGTNAVIERIIDRILNSVEAVIEIPFDDEDEEID